MCDCAGCPRRAVWQTSSVKEPGYRWAECDVHAAESRKRGYTVRTLRKDRSAPPT